MSQPISLLILLLVLSACTSVRPSTAPGAADAAEPLRVMTFNIRFNNPNDGEHAWPHRTDRVAGLIRFHDADLLGVQEALRGQLDDLQARLPGYRWFGVGRDDGRDAGEFTAIFYRADRFELLREETFWLSETPEVPGSKSWDAALTRIATWGQFRDRRTGRTFFLFNTHFDHRGERAREESAQLIADRISAVAGSAPAVLLGDFNVPPSSAAYATLTRTLTDAHQASERGHYGPDFTFGTFLVSSPPGQRIDYIFVKNGIDVLRHGALSDQWAGHYPSDHLPVLAEIRLP